MNAIWEAIIDAFLDAISDASYDARNIFCLLAIASLFFKTAGSSSLDDLVYVFICL